MNIPTTIRDCLWVMKSPSDRDRVLRLCQHIVARGRWPVDELDALAALWHAPVPVEKWRRECVFCLDRIVAEGKPDAMDFLRRAIVEESRRVRDGGRAIEYIWWLKDNYPLLARPRDTNPDIIVEQHRKAAKMRGQINDKLENL